MNTKLSIMLSNRLRTMTAVQERIACSQSEASGVW